MQPENSQEQNDKNEPIELPIDGVLDLHMFRPREIKELVPDYLEACRERGIFRVRIIHGKGMGNLRRTVHSILGKLPNVEAFALAGEQLGGWGATVVHLSSRQDTREQNSKPGDSK
jgi:DNA-nicking Smr family endonuclease